MKHLFTLLCVGLILFSCADNSGDPEALVTGRPANARIQLVAMPISSAGNAVATRASGGSDALEVRFGSMSTRAGETTVDKSEAEKTIVKAWLLQFNGTASTATLTGAPQELAVDAEGYADCNIETSSSVRRVYVIANVDAATVGKLTTSTTLAVFEKTVFPQTGITAAELTTKGLPMFAYQDFVPAEVIPGTFRLESCMAKVTFSYAIKSGLNLPEMTATVHNIPDGIVCKNPVATVDAQQPAGITYSGTLDVTAANASAVTVYVPADLAGQNAAVTKETDRSSANAKDNAMCIEISGSSDVNDILTIVNYSIYLGDLPTNPGDFNVQGNYSYEVAIVIKGINTAVDKRVEGGSYRDLNTELDDNGKPKTANCYIVTSGGDYYFDATVMGNGATTPAHTKSAVSGDDDLPAIIPSKLSPVKADVLWETLNTVAAPATGDIVSPNIYLLKDKILFKAGAKQGNAVIAAKDAKGDIIWSWHIWRINAQPAAITLANLTSTSGNFDATGNTTLSGLQVMDRNLGALNATAQDNGSIGLLYQWGRKDPFPGGADFANPKTTIATTLEASNTSGAYSLTASGGSSITPADAVKNPTTFYTGDDWTSRNDNLWGTPLIGTVTIASDQFNSNAGSKSIYDPCPAGWRVAPGYAFANASTSNGGTFNKGYAFGTGFTSSGSVWFPASGYRNYNNGTLESLGVIGSYWTSAPSVNFPTIGIRLYFMDSIVSPTSNLERSFGFSVRCVQE